MVRDYEPRVNALGYSLLDLQQTEEFPVGGPD
jgi:hypothetical protein